MTNKDLDKFLSERLAKAYNLRCVMCSGEPQLATHSTSEGDSVCENCAREYAIAEHFADEAELDAYFAGTASEGFTRRVERWWKWYEES